MKPSFLGTFGSRVFDLMRSKAALAVAAASDPAWAVAYTLADFGLDTLSTELITLALLGFTAVAGVIALGVGAESIFGIMIRWSKRAFGGR